MPRKTKSIQVIRKEYQKKPKDFSKGRTSGGASYKARNKYGSTGPEIKFHDTVVATNVTGNTTGLCLPLSDIIIGTSDQTRIGNKVIAKSIEIHGEVTTQATANTLNPQTWHMFIAVDREPDLGGIAAYSEVYTTPTGMQQSGFRYIPNSERFDILWHERFVMTTRVLGNYALGPNHFLIDKYAKIDIPLKYNGSGSGQANNATNQLIFGFICNGSSSDELLDLTSRVRFLDE